MESTGIWRLSEIALIIVPHEESRYFFICWRLASLISVEIKGSTADLNLPTLTTSACIPSLSSVSL